MLELIDKNVLKNHLYYAQAIAFMDQNFEAAGFIAAFIQILDEQPIIEADPVWLGMLEDAIDPFMQSKESSNF